MPPTGTEQLALDVPGWKPFHAIDALHVMFRAPSVFATVRSPVRTVTSLLLMYLLPLFPVWLTCWPLIHTVAATQPE